MLFMTMGSSPVVFSLRPPELLADAITRPNAENQSLYSYRLTN